MSRCSIDRGICGKLPRRVCKLLAESDAYELIDAEIEETGESIAVAAGQFISAHEAESIRQRTGSAQRMTAPIRHAGHEYGHLSVWLPRDCSPDANESDLLIQIAQDVGFALGAVTKREETSWAAEWFEDDEILRECFDGLSVGLAFIHSHEQPLSVNPAFAAFVGYERSELEAMPSTEAVRLISHPDDYQHEMVLLHSLMRRESRSYTLEKRFVRKDGELAPGLVTMTFFFSDDGLFRFGVCTVQDISERVTTRAELTRAYEGAIEALIAALESRDPYTAGHQRHVTQLACAIGEEMQLDEKTCMGIRVASILHDIGKIAIPAEILTKPYGVSETERALIRAHPQLAYDILKGIHFPWPVAQIVRQHHERLDGSGYPLGLKGDEILLEARILAVADVVEALVSYRPYRAAIPIGDAVKHIEEHRGVLFDADAVAACSRVLAGGFRFHYEEAELRHNDTLD